MKHYSVYEAKARFSELIRGVRGGRSVVITYRGRPVAEIRPIKRDEPALEERLEDLEKRGLLIRARHDGPVDLRPVTRRPGALDRFLEERAD